MLDLISIGDVVIDTFIPLVDAEVIKSGNEPKLALRLGDKIPVGPSVSLVAGNAANNAVGASRLGIKTTIYTNIGNDEDGETVRKKFKTEKVDTRYVVTDKTYPTCRHFVLDFKGERTILIYHQPWEYKLPELESARWVYLTSLSASFINSDIIQKLIQYLERTGAKLFYNPGTFQIKLGVKKNPRLLSLTDCFIVNVEEAKLVLGLDEYKNIPIKKLLQGLINLGPKMVVITDGKNGSFGSDGENFYQLENFPAKLVEMTGAGDAYATGLLAGFINGKNLPEAMRWGTANGASVIEQVGPQAGLLTKEQMLAKLKENAKIIHRELK